MGKMAPKAPSLPPALPVPQKESDAEEKAKKEEASRIARSRSGLGSTINTSGTGAMETASTARRTLLGD